MGIGRDSDCLLEHDASRITLEHLTPVFEQLLRSAYPQLLPVLAKAGWSPHHEAELPHEEDALGFVLHDLAAQFLRHFSEVKLRVPSKFNRFSSNQVWLGLHEPLGRMDPAHSAYYVHALAETSFVFPVCTTGNSVGFLLDDGRLLSIDETWRGCSWNRDVFAFAHWRLFSERLPGTTTRQLTHAERPVEYRWD